MLVVGDREAEDGTVSVRRHREGDEGAEAVDALADTPCRRQRRPPSLGKRQAQRVSRQLKPGYTPAG